MCRNKKMKKKEIVLFHPRTFHEKNYRNFWIPYSILTVGSELRSNGYDVCLIDNNLEALDGNEFSGLVNKILTDQTLFVGISCMIGNQIREGLEFASNVREERPEIPLVWGGPAPTIIPEYFQRSSLVDILVKGQGEATALELANHLSNTTRHSINNIGGISYKVEDKFITNQDRNLLPKENFARYNYSILPTEKYLRSDEHINDRVLNHFSSQGCPYECGFCSEVALYNRKWMPELVDRTIDEVSDLIDVYGANGIKFYDSNFFVNKKRALSFARAVLDKGWDIKWAASAHPKNILVCNDEELDLIKRSGCSRILIGAESGNDEELRYIKKNMTKKDVIQVAERLGNLGIHGSFTVIIGYPGFPEENIERTLEFGRKLREISDLHEIKAHAYAPYPGTPLYQDAIRHGFVPPKTLEDWADYDYYEVQTPWLKKGLNEQIIEFNKLYCPYVL